MQPNTHVARWQVRLAPLTGYRGVMIGAEDDDDDDGDDATELIRLRDENRTLRSENARRRTANKDLQKQLDDAQNSSTSSDAKVQNRIKELEAGLATSKKQASKYRAERTIIAAAGDFADPEDVLRMLDTDGFVDEDGNVDSRALKSAIKSLANSKPYLLKQSDASNGKDEDEGDEGEEDKQDEPDSQEQATPPRNFGKNNGSAGRGEKKAVSGQQNFATRVAAYEKEYLDSGRVPMPDLG